MRVIRGAKALSEYLKLVNCDMSESTIYRFMRTESIPYKRPSTGVLIFELDAINKWLDNKME